jgi:hypothetical protein
VSDSIGQLLSEPTGIIATLHQTASQVMKRAGCHGQELEELGYSSCALKDENTKLRRKRKRI